MDPLENAILSLYQKGYCCSQVLALLILGVQGRENPDLVRSLSGLCHGIGRSGDACGILTGGCCVLAYLVGRETADDDAVPGAQLVIEEFVDWFREAATEQWGSIRCTDILGDEAPGGPDKSHCRRLLAQAIQARRITIFFFHIWKHRFNGFPAHFRGGRIIRIYFHLPHSFM